MNYYEKHIPYEVINRDETIDSNSNPFELFENPTLCKINEKNHISVLK